MPPVRSLDPYDIRKREIREWIGGRISYHGITQTELARRAGISKSTLSEHIRTPEKMTLREVWALEKVLGRFEK